MSSDEPPTKKKKFSEEDPMSSDEEGDEDDFELEEFDDEVEETSQQDEKNTFEHENKEWLRPTPKEEDTLYFQQLYADYTIGTNNPKFTPHKEKVGPIIRLYGSTEEGNSVLCHVYGYIPYFYVKPPPGMNNIQKFQEILTKKMADLKFNKKDGMEFIVGIEKVSKMDILRYSFGKNDTYFKIYVGMPPMVPRVRKLLEEGFDIEGFGFRKFLTYESNILFVLRCMIDSDIPGANWIKLKKFEKKKEKTSHCQLEIEVSVNDVISLEPVEEWSKIAPFRVLSFDIECAGKNGHFPAPEKDPVIMIANYVTLQGDEHPIIKNVFVLGTCAPIAGAEVICFDKESDLLRAWRDFVIQVDPDILTGYNIVNFDMVYLIKRANHLSVPKFTQLGRLSKTNAKIKSSTLKSKQMGARETKDIVLEGRVQLDCMQAVQRDYKLSSYSLNAVSAHFLGEQKENVHHSIITQLYDGDDSTRRRLAVYCLKDAYLPQRLLDKLMIIINYIEMARVTGIPISFILERGQQIKVVSQLLRKAKDKGYIMPTPISKESTLWNGGKVFDPKTGYYTVPIATLDFASLYPSIMIANNLCYSTLLKKEDVSKLNSNQYIKTPYGAFFVKSSEHKGLLPEILEELLSARKVAKKDMKNETDPMRKNVLNGRQLALKVSANSVYGFTGAQMGLLPCLDISASVTALGREMILKTKEVVEDKYSIKNGYKWNSEVIYGDTDSVMVKFGTKDIVESMELGKEAADFVSTYFQKPICLQFEKVYSPYLLMAKKRYAGLKWTNPDKYDYLDTVGLETVRRDNCQLVRTMISNILELCIVQGNINAAIEYTKTVISDLLMNRLDISMLIVTKSISKKVDDYNSKQTHTELAKKMMKRDPATAPLMGDRVPYVIIKSTNNAKAYEKSEDPIYVLTNNIPIDTKYYLEHHLSKPLIRVFTPMMKNPQSLLNGPHTRNIFIPTPKVGGIMKFAQKKLTCMKCRVGLKGDQKNLCSDCQPKEKEIYQEILVERNHYENIYSRVWTQCQRCQGSLHQDVLCSNRDCPVFYMRKKVQIDLKEKQDKLDRFNNDIPDW